MVMRTRLNITFYVHRLSCLLTSVPDAVDWSVTLTYTVQFTEKPEVEPFKAEAQTALFKDPVRTAL
jgi:hypothetical protein